MQGRTITVTFHAIVPKALWKWDELSRMHIRFGHKDLGEWQHNTGVFMESRYMCVLVDNLQMYMSSFLSRHHHEDYHEMTCTLHIQEELLRNPLEYKYVIFSPRMTGKDDCYEFLHSFAGYLNRNYNRCLSIEETKIALDVKGNAEYSFHYMYIIA